MARKMLPSMLLALSASPAAAATPRNILMITVDGTSAPAPAAARERSSCALRDCAPARRHSPNRLLRHMADLRPQLNVAYGMTETITPNLDKFAEGALTFHRAYCQQAVCVAALLLPSCLLRGWAGCAQCPVSAAEAHTAPRRDGVCAGARRPATRS
eukprot:COSAG06_NODE_3367_length_5442_cov_3.104810_3_plen_157_part_00